MGSSIKKGIYSNNNCNWELVNKIEQNGGRTVYRAQNSSNKNIQLFKYEIREYEQKSQKNLVQFKDKIIKLRHQNLVKYVDFNLIKHYDHYRSEYNLYVITIQPLYGISLKKIIQTQKLTLSKIITIYQQLKNAIQYLHQNDIIHGKIYLQNVIYNQINQLIILSNYTYPSQVKTIDNLTIRQYYYLAPQSEQNFRLSFSTDLWNLGILLIELLICRSIERQDIQILKSNPDRYIKGLNGSEQLNKILQKLLKKDGNQRKLTEIEEQQTCDEFMKFKNVREIKRKLTKSSDSSIIKLSNCILNQEALKMIFDSPIKQLKLYAMQIPTSFFINIPKTIQSLTISFTKLSDQSDQPEKQISFSLPHQNQINQFKLQYLNNVIQSQQLQKIIKQLKPQKLTKLSLLGKTSYQKNFQLLSINDSQKNFPHQYFKYIINDISSIYSDYFNGNSVLKINENVINSLQRFKNLQQLYIKAQQKDLSRLILVNKNLKKICIIGNLNQQSYLQIFKYKNLQSLYLESKQIHIKSKSFINHDIQDNQILSTNILSLQFVNCTLNISQLSQNILKKLTKLKVLNLSKNSLRDTDIKTILSCSIYFQENLQVLNLSQNNIQIKSIIEISKLKKLKHLNLSYCNIEIDVNVSLIANNQTELQQLNICKNNISNIHILEVTSKLTKLTYLNIGSHRIQPNIMRNISQKLSQLKILQINNCGINDETMRMMDTDQCVLQKLQVLNADENLLSNEGAFIIAKKLLNLKHLNLWTNKIMYQGIKELMKNLKKIRNIFLQGNKITPKQKKQIKNLLNKNGPTLAKKIFIII